ncbi:hypothetical protein PILCRDRAFT_459480 [Piloderma croceum F 1598]|uniref:F-box domain-containing protein n=1 Tax=Piloderma croceum (strain F 1598) TaxID=765440 RepID=A0A0C3FWN3_PILCF|nr:hypothetical protein PILCRDRAFT_459480 [Piloderma croceum F 1598]
MVSAQNLNLDVLELVFAHLATGNDLASVALVSRSFLAGVIPRLYETLLFQLSQAKRYPSVTAPFAAILKHPGLAKHVRNIEIQAVPLLKSPLSQFDPKFLKDSSEALRICRNVSSFTCICPILPPLLLSLQEKPRLQEIRIHARLTADQSGKLRTLKGLRSITLDHASWNVVDMLPAWVGANKTTLTSLTLYMAADLNEIVLENALSQLPELLSLHVIGCPRVDHTAVFRCVRHTPLLESLSFTTVINDSSSPLTTPHPRLPNLVHLTLDSRLTLAPAPPNSTSLLSRLLTDILLPSSSPLRSLSIRLADRQLCIPDSWVEELLKACWGTLKRISFGNCVVGNDSVKNICARCPQLETLELAIPIRELRPFALAVAQSSTLKTLIDNSDPHATHTPKVALTRDNIRYVMLTVHALRTVECDGRIWTRCGSVLPYSDLRISLERRATSSHHWFVPLE